MNVNESKKPMRAGDKSNGNEAQVKGRGGGSTNWGGGRSQTRGGGAAGSRKSNHESVPGPSSDGNSSNPARSVTHNHNGSGNIADRNGIVNWRSRGGRGRGIGARNAGNGERNFRNTFNEPRQNAFHGNRDNWTPNNTYAANRARKQTTKHLTDKILNDFLGKEPLSVVMEFCQLFKSNPNLFDEEDWKPQRLYLFVRLLKEKVLESSGVDSYKNQILTRLCKSESFWNKMKDHLFGLLVEAQEMEINTSNTTSFYIIINEFLQNSYAIYEYISNTMRSLTTTFMNPHLKSFVTVIGILKRTYTDHFLSLEELETNFKGILEIQKEYDARVEQLVIQTQNLTLSFREAAKQRRDIEAIWKGFPPEDFRGIPIVPTIEELVGQKEAFLRPNLKEGAYPNAEVYLDVQFRLLREDFVAPLRTGVKEYLDHKLNFAKLTSRNSVKVYKNVSILPGLNLDTRTPSYTVLLDKYDHFIRRIKWDKSKRLLNGSLLVFTNDNMQTAYFATVTRRDVNELTNDATFCITWEAGRKPNFQNFHFDMLECDIFFESYRYTLTSLQQLKLDKFPLNPYIINAQSEKKVPKYILAFEDQVSFNMLLESCKDKKQDLALRRRFFREKLLGKDTASFMEKHSEQLTSGLANLTDEHSWPTSTELGMDETQYAAFKAGLTREISVIQGPPGTGKTYIGIQIAKFVLGNEELFFPTTEQKSCPILVVCYTNHALDQFLEAILHVMLELGQYKDGSLIRIGGMSKSEELTDLTIYKQFDRARGKRSFPTTLQDTCHYAHKDLQSLKNSRLCFMHTYKCLTQPSGILNFGELIEVILKPRGIQIRLTDTENDIIKFLDSLELFKVIRLFYLEPRAIPVQDFKVDFTPLIRTLCPLVSNRHHETEPINPSTPSSSEQVELKEEDDSEDYDLEELMQNRLLEIEHEVHENDNKFKPSFLDWRLDEKKMEQEYRKINAGIHQFELILKDENSSAENKVAANYELYERSLYKMRDEESNKYPNQQRLLKRVLTLYQQRRLTLLKMNEKETNQLLQNLRHGNRDLYTAHLVWSFYFSMLEKFGGLILPKVYEIEKNILTKSVEYEEARNACEGYLLCNAKFVGMTTTGAAKYNSLLKMMGSKMVIVEEAAEVLESHIVTSITEKCEHLILIGDHKQLKPKNSAYELTKNYNFDVSLFERLINNDLQCYTLEIQHRMRPEIAALLVPTIYSKLENDDSVLSYPDVAGVATNLFFINHQELEKEDADVSSHANEHEAHFLIALCKHLIWNGYSKDRITILTTYIGQVFLMKKIIRDEPLCQGVRVTAVDNFQGEENDIILLSLVRSNDANKVGFVKIDNRICVSLSRAKHGMFVIGNFDCMISASPKWREIVDKLKNNTNPGIGTQLQLKCQIHTTTASVATKEDFATVSPCGGCSEICNQKLPKCSHNCPQICHGTDIEHMLYKCRFSCENKCKKYGHQCKSVCYKDPCPECKVKVDTKLKCGHTHPIECFFNAEEYKCPTVVERLLPSCGHSLEMKCHENPREQKCPVYVSKEISRCGHVHKLRCSVDITQFHCLNSVVVKIPDCGHELEMECYRSFHAPESWTCKTRCDTRVANCGHACTRQCHVRHDPNHENYKCNKDCSRLCGNGHKCGEAEGHKHNHKCHSKCPPCKVLTEIELPCGHKRKLECNKTLNEEFMASYLCKEKVNKLSPCGHEIRLHCFEVADQSRCEFRVASRVKSSCGHGVDVPCRISLTATPEDCLKYCEQPCGMPLNIGGIGCKHNCTGTCSSCHQGRLHIKCTDKCTRVLVCGHVCKAPCSTVCPPCEADCDIKCEHSACKLKCGVPCISCNEPCGVKCEHQACTKLCGEKCDVKVCNAACYKILDCGHPCIGLCSEKCPKLCRICDEDEVKEIVLGFEDEEDARFVVLEDCGHTFELKGLNKWMETKPEENRVLTKKCPHLSGCSSIIKNSKRYKSILSVELQKVMKAKATIYGNPNQIFKEQLKVSKKIVEFSKELTGEKIPNELKYLTSYVSSMTFLPHLNPILVDEKKLKSRYRNYAYEDPLAYNLKRVNQNELETISNFVNWLGITTKNLNHAIEKFPPKLTKHFLSKFMELWEILISASKNNNGILSKFQIEQFRMEFNKLIDYFEVVRRLGYITKELTNSQEYLRLALIIEQKILNYKKQYMDDFRNRILEALKRLDALLQNEFQAVYIPDRSIFQAMANSREAWYHCPNGHLYAVGECGNLNESSRCPDCKSGVGGGSQSRRVTHQVSELPAVAATIGKQREKPDFL